MSASLAIKHARAVRQRLRYPRNAVADQGIDLKRKPELRWWPKCRPPRCTRHRHAVALTYALTPTEPPPVSSPLSVRTIQRAVCQHYGVTFVDLMSNRRTRALALPRQVAVWLCRKLTTRSLPAIGQQFGGRDHTTMLHAARRIDELRQTDAAMQARLDAFVAALSPDGA